MSLFQHWWPLTEESFQDSPVGKFRLFLRETDGPRWDWTLSHPDGRKVASGSLKSRPAARAAGRRALIGALSAEGIRVTPNRPGYDPDFKTG